MTENFNVSVIIPVFNAEKYLDQAVESAIMQKETHKIILIEDGSSDNSLKLCMKLADNYHKVKLLRHPNGKNMGAGASRNMGIQSTQYEYISFLDADDYYLPNRFNTTKNVFKENPQADGVYEAVGTIFETESAKKVWFENRSSLITTFKKPVSPEDLFFSMMHRNDGSFCTDGIVLKKTAFDRIGYFDTELELSEDKILWLKASILLKLFPGNLTSPVAIRRMHGNNRCLPKTQKHLYFGMKRFQILLNWGIDKKINRKYLKDIFHKLLRNAKKYYNKENETDIYILYKIIFDCPRIVLFNFYWKTFMWSVIQLLNKNRKK